MASTYSALKVELMQTGENAGTWGGVTNVNLGTALEEAIVGSADVTFASADVTLTLTDTNATQTARNLRLNLVGTVAGPQNLIVPAIEKLYIISNTLGQTITVKNLTGTGIAVPAGKTLYVYNDGTNVLDAVTHLTSLTLGSALPVGSGGTGISSVGTTGNVLTSNGTVWISQAIPPSDNASNITSGILAVAYGGTGSTTATFSGANITSLNASNISSGTIANARTTAASANGASTIVARDASGNFTGYNVSATNFIGTLNGDGSNVSSINASNISSGTLANARTTAASANGASTIVARDASGNFTGYNVSATNFIGTLNGDGSNVSSINASNISSGTIANARTTAASANGASTIVARDASGNFTGYNVSATNFIGTLNGDGSNVSSINASNISSGTLANARTTASSSNGASTIVTRDASGNFSANTITATLTGTASNATAVTGTTSNGYGTRTVSTGDPTGGSDGDIWYKY